MNWQLQPEFDLYYSLSRSFMDFFEGFTYDHVNFIFSDVTYPQESTYSTMNTNPYKFAYSEPGSFSYYHSYCDAYAINEETYGDNGFTRQQENTSTMANERSTAVHAQQSSHADPADCPQSNHNSADFQVVWEDNVDPDNMTYEELLELGEVVGSQSRGLSPEAISLLPVSKFKCSYFWRKKSKNERCVICQMEYKRGERQIILPCKHIYHAGCGSQWLGINKACPICYKEVLVNAPKHSKRFCK
uniref:E3 ubiquitin-protein ligase BIG BROTHER-like n=1 Tax=Erigeron canadensis TaxID=72917 RepID=UPI001CB99BCF|nr:E3 ubiquitin-protein ligase BIG BROTHER-like [Erigeron canadensis]XP_043637447.1 E3 ubiquitin-protein ligase BIG BROTHER-like [Erigeron canadensis]